LALSSATPSPGIAGQTVLRPTDVPAGWSITTHPGAIGSALARALGSCTSTVAGAQAPRALTVFTNAAGAAGAGLALVTGGGGAASAAFRSVTSLTFRQCARSILTNTGAKVTHAGAPVKAHVAIAHVSTSTWSFGFTASPGPSPIDVAVVWAIGGRVLVGTAIEGPGSPSVSQLVAQLQAMVNRARALAP
jgi:hypothetical protein